MKIPFNVTIPQGLFLTSQVTHAPDLSKRRIAFFRCGVGCSLTPNRPGDTQRLWVYTRKHSFFIDWLWL